MSSKLPILQSIECARWDILCTHKNEVACILERKCSKGKSSQLFGVSLELSMLVKVEVDVDFTVDDTK